MSERGVHSYLSNLFFLLSVTDHCCDNLCEAYPEHVVELRQFHYAVGGVGTPLIELGQPAEGHNRAIVPEFLHEFLNLFGPVRLVEDVHEKEDDGRDERNEHPHDPHVRPDHLANAQDLVDYPLEARHIALLDQLMLEYAVLDLLLGEVYVIWEQLEELLSRSILPFFFLLQFQVSHVDLRVQLSSDSIEQDVYANVQGVLQDVLKAADSAAQVTLLEDVGEKAVPAESMAALQSHGLHERLQTDGTAELLAEKLLLDLTDESWLGAVAVRWTIRPLFHRTVDSCVYGGVRMGARLVTLCLFSLAIDAAFDQASLSTLLGS